MRNGVRMSITQDRQLISLNTPLGNNKLVLMRMEGQEALSSPFHFSLETFSEDININERSLMGKAISFKIQESDHPPRFFHGYVKDFVKKQNKFTHVKEYRLEVVPWLWFLTLSQDCRIFQNKTVVEICEALFKEFGFSDFEVSLSQTYPKREYCVQYNETAFSFISRLLEEEGIFYYFRHEEKKHTLILSDLSSQCPYIPNKDISYAQGSLLKNHINNWEQSYHFCSGEYTHTDYNATKPTIDLLTTTKTSVKFETIEKYKFFQFPGSYTEKEAGSKISRLRMEQQEQRHSIGKGESDLYHFTPGARFVLKDSQDSSQKGEYLVSSVYHKAQDLTHVLYRDFHEQNEEVQSYTNNFTCIPSSIPYKAPLATPKPKIHGLQVARVTGPSQEEIYTDEYGRIKVQFLWDRQNERNETSSCWIRVAQRWAGPQWGSLFIPRVGHEVIIDFLEGNPDCPIVIGSLYNAQNKPPYELPTNQTQSGIKSRSTAKGGASDSNEIRFEDKKEHEQIFIHAQKDCLRMVENNDELHIKGQQDIEIQKDRKQTIQEGNEILDVKKGDRTITLGTGNETLKVSQGNRETTINMGKDTLHLQQGNHSIKLDLGKSTIEALQGIELKVGQNKIKIDQTGITIEGLMVKVNGQAMVQINASTLLKLQGSLVMIN